LLNNPAVQAALVPFVVALVLGALLRNTRLSGLAIGAGFLSLVALAIGFSFESLTSVRKMVLVGSGATAFVLVGELANIQPGRAVRAIVAAVLALATLWVAQRVLAQREGLPLVLACVGIAIFMVVLVDGMVRLGDDSVRGASASLMLGLGTGAIALLGASASLAQVGIAVGASSGAVLLVQMVSGRRLPAGWTLALPAAAIAGVICVMSVLTGGIPWYCLIPVLLAPWAARLVPLAGRSVWLASLLAALAALLPMLLAVALAWFTAGASPS
jgi:hypothetical protein